jgi:hypothetical protein
MPNTANPSQCTTELRTCWLCSILSSGQPAELLEAEALHAAERIITLSRRRQVSWQHTAIKQGQQQPGQVRRGRAQLLCVAVCEAEAGSGTAGGEGGCGLLAGSLRGLESLQV